MKKMLIVVAFVAIFVLGSTLAFKALANYCYMFFGPLIVVNNTSEEIVERLLLAISLVSCLLLAIGLSRIHIFFTKHENSRFFLYFLLTVSFWFIGIGIRTVLLAITLPALRKTLGETNISIGLRMVGFPEWAFGSALAFVLLTTFLLYFDSLLKNYRMTR
ncbi:MAG: hypothetical protein IPG44_07155 [Anaerolineales bacterium]|jgi:hypothetical protein|nr:hypothetical protein [Anaerolineales bacterium]